MFGCFLSCFNISGSMLKQNGDLIILKWFALGIEFMNKNRASGILTSCGAGDESIRGKLNEFITINPSHSL